jgi:hypothetical protein
MQLRAHLPPALFRCDWLARLEQREQRLRLRDLRRFRRRCEVFERGREDGVGVGAAGG